MNGLILCTRECNMRCQYCFEEPMHSDKITPIKKIREDFAYFLENHFDNFIRQLIAINDAQNRRESNFTFHGGEPLLIGTDLLRRAFEMVKMYPNTVISTQTNGSLIDDEMADLLAEYKVSVGVSLDGPEYMHDAYRLNCAGRGTFDSVMAGIKKLRQRGCEPGALATVTDVTLKDPEGFYNFFVEHNLSFSFNPCIMDPNKKSNCSVINTNEFIAFYKEMFDLWISDNNHELPISCFDRIISAMTVKRKPYMEVCSYIPDCSRTTVAIDTSGDFYRCLHYCMDGKNRIGNLGTDPLTEALQSCDISCRWDYLKEHECRDCDIQDYCCGGCPYTAEAETGSVMTRAGTCSSQKAIVHHIYNYIKQYAR